MNSELELLSQPFLIPRIHEQGGRSAFTTGLNLEHSSSDSELSQPGLQLKASDRTCNIMSLGSLQRTLRDGSDLWRMAT